MGLRVDILSESVHLGTVVPVHRHLQVQRLLQRRRQRVVVHQLHRSIREDVARLVRFCLAVDQGQAAAQVVHQAVQLAAQSGQHVAPVLLEFHL